MPNNKNYSVNSIESTRPQWPGAFSIHLSMKIISMKTVVMLSGLLLSGCACSCSGTSNKAEKTAETYTAQISFADSIHDFGIFSSESPLRKHTFTFTNNGDIPAVVLSVAPSCQCTSAEYTRNAVRPGEQGTVTVIFDGTKAQPGYFSKSVRVRINSTCIHTLRVEGEMK